MNREQMLKQMGLSEQDFTDLVSKISNLRNSLNPAQKAAFDSALPTADDLAKSLSDNVTAADVEKHLSDATAPKGVMAVVWGRSQS